VLDLCATQIYGTCMPKSASGKPGSFLSTPVKVLDLFAGAGGLTQGFVEAKVPHETVRAVELDIPAAATFAANYGDVVYAGAVEDWLREESVPSSDIVVGGPPCQGFSQLGRRDASDLRNGLWRHYAETIRLSQPKYFVMENVPRFHDSPELALMWQATQRGGVLEEYTFETAVLNAADYGAAQLRRRAIVIGHHRDLPFPGFPDATVEPSAYATVKDVLSGLDEKITEKALPPGTVEFAGRELPGDFATDQLHLTRDYRPISTQRFAAIPLGGNRFSLPPRLQAPCWRKHQSGSGDVMGRLHWDRPSVTIRTEFFKPEKGRYLHPAEPRAITHHEAARIQGFPDSYRWVGSKTAIARQIGNAVPIPLASALARHLADAIGKSIC
jgi:DNA (cytosine-5)-methyltransferase 1